MQPHLIIAAASFTGTFLGLYLYHALKRSLRSFRHKSTIEGVVASAWDPKISQAGPCGQVQNLTPVDEARSRKNHHLPTHLPGSNSSGPHRSNSPSSGSPESPLPSFGDLAGSHSPGIAKGRRALARTLAILSRQEVQQAMRPFWQIDDMLHQLRRLERLRRALPEEAWASGASARPPAPPAAHASKAPNLHSSGESNSSPDPTTATPAPQA